MKSKGKTLFLRGGTPREAIEGICGELIEYVEQAEADRDIARKQVEKWNRNDEIQEAEREKLEAFRQLRMGFNPSEDQWDEIKAWQKKHDREFHPRPEDDICFQTKRNPFAGEYEYRFSHTPVGTIGSVVCTECEKRFKASWKDRDRYSYMIGEI